MTALTWDNIGEREFETGVDHGVLYIPTNGIYDTGVAWSGLTAVTESPSGAEANALYADNIKYLNLISTEQFGATIEAYTYPDEFAQFDGLVVPTPGVAIGQQSRKTFGFSFRTRIGNDVEGDALGFKYHLVYGCTAAPSEKAYATVNESPEAITFSWEISTIPVAVTGHRPTSLITINSLEVDGDALDAFLTILYGGVGSDPRLPLPDEVVSIFEAGAPVVATPVAPTYNAGTHTITIPTTTGIDYRVDGVIVAAGALVITEDTIVVATTKPGYKFPTTAYDADWLFEY
jgi:hypothetical protein